MPTTTPLGNVYMLARNSEHPATRRAALGILCHGFTVIDLRYDVTGAQHRAFQDLLGAGCNADGHAGYWRFTCDGAQQCYLISDYWE